MISTKPKTLVLREADIARTCSEYLQHDGWRMLITDPVSDKSRGKGFGEIGMADRLYLRYGGDIRRVTPASAPQLVNIRAMAQVMFIEWKRIAHGKPTKATLRQKEWHRYERARGALTLIAGEDFKASIEGFIAWYRASGLARRVR